MRTGIGYDIHKLVKDRKLILGGEEIKHEFGLEGHSDADVVVHSICDALLGAASLGDIGMYFPDTDDKYKDISSIKIYKKLKNNYLLISQLLISLIIIFQIRLLQKEILKNYQIILIGNISHP